MNTETFDSVLSKICSFATSIVATTAVFPLLPPPPTYAVNAAICF